MSRFIICTVSSLCCGLNNEDERQSASLTGALYCTSTRYASSRYAGGDRNGETPAAGNERESAYALCLRS
jgi:hypothetical protein